VRTGGDVADTQHGDGLKEPELGPRAQVAQQASDTFQGLLEPPLGASEVRKSQPMNRDRGEGAI